MLTIHWIDEGEEYFEPVPQQYGPPTQHTALMNKLMLQAFLDSNTFLRKLQDKSPIENFGKIGTTLRIRLPPDFTVKQE